MRRERAIDAQPGAEDVVDDPVAFLQIEDRDVGLPADGVWQMCRNGTISV
jgi:hypothetical protein